MAKHVLTFTGDIPNDAMKQHAILGNPDVVAARGALEAALTKAGAPHAAESKVVRTPAPGAAPRGRRPAAAAAE